MAILHIIIMFFSSLQSPLFSVLILFLLDHSHCQSQYQLKENSFCSSPTSNSKGKISAYELLKANTNLLFLISTFFFLLVFLGSSKEEKHFSWLAHLAGISALALILKDWISTIPFSLPGRKQGSRKSAWYQGKCMTFHQKSALAPGTTLWRHTDEKGICT